MEQGVSYGSSVKAASVSKVVSSSSRSDACAAAAAMRFSESGTEDSGGGVCFTPRPHASRVYKPRGQGLGFVYSDALRRRLGSAPPVQALPPGNIQQRGSRRRKEALGAAQWRGAGGAGGA